MANDPSAASSSEHHEVAGLEEAHLGRGGLTGLALASFIPAVGLASVPYLLFGTAGNGSWLGALAAAVATCLVGCSVVAFARRFVVTGSLYSYMAHVFGPWARVLAAATLLLSYVAAVAVAAFIIGLFAGSFLVSVGVESGLDAGVVALVCAASVGIAATLAYRGIDASVRIAVALTVLTVPLILLITVASALHTGLALGDQLSLEGSSVTGIVQGIAAGAVFLVGFESCTALAAETRDPHRTVPVAVMSVPVVLGAAYVIVTFLQVPGLIAAGDALERGASAPAALALNAGLGEGVAKATDAVLAVAAFTALIGYVNYGARFVATLAADRLIPAAAARVHPRHRSPSTAIVVLALLALASLLPVLLLTPSIFDVYASFGTLAVYFWVVPYLLVCAGAIVLLARERSLTPWFAASAVLGAAAMGWLYVNGIVNPPAPPVDAMSWVALGASTVAFAAFLLLERRSRAPSGRD